MSKKHIIYMLAGILIVFSLSTVGGATTSSDYDYERDAPSNVSLEDTIEVTIEVHTEGEVIEEFDYGLVHPEITESSADEAYVEDGKVIASFTEPGTLTYEVRPGIADIGVVEYNITAAGSLETPDTVIEVDTGGRIYEPPITLQTVSDAIDDWRVGDVPLELLSDLITAWQEGESPD